MDTRVRGYDKKEWLPACTGMTFTAIPIPVLVTPDLIGGPCLLTLSPPT